MKNTETSILIPGPVGKLETCLQIPQGDSAQQFGILCHPHPLHGGTLHNKVITTLSRTFNALALPNIRFNYRGVGQSEGSYDEGRGETTDTLAIVQWAQQRWPEKKLILAGFSFGAYVALRAATQTKVQQLVTIAPAVNHADFSGLHPHAPWLVVIAEKDTIVPSEDIHAWADTLHPRPEVLSFPHATHFFDGQLVTLKESLIKKLSVYVTP